MSNERDPVPMSIVLPSFGEWKRGDVFVKPKVLMLEIKDKHGLTDESVGIVIVERHESYECYPDGRFKAAVVRLSYKRITGRYSQQNVGQGYFTGCFTSDMKTVSLTSSIAWSDGAVFLDLPGLKGQRVGTYLMNEIVAWVKQWPDAKVACIKLDLNQAGADNKERRNRFYEQFGIVFDYDDEHRRSGKSLPMRVSELKTVESWKQNIIEHIMQEYLELIFDQNERLSSELEARNRACNTLIAEQKQAEARPLRWALRQLCFRYSQLFIVGLVIISMIGISWFKATLSN